MKRSLFILLFTFLSVIFFPARLSAKTELHQQIDSISEKKIIVDSILITTPHHTRAPFIIREIGFHTGDTLLYADLEKILQESHNALVNTNLFNSVTLTPVFSPDHTHMHLEIAVDESWQLFAFPTIKFADRNINAWLRSNEPNKFGRISYGLSFKIGNFTGRREHLIVKLAAGYNYTGNIQYTLPYINKEKTWGILTSLTFNISKETNYGTQNDLAVFYRKTSGFSRHEFNLMGGIQYSKTSHSIHQFKLLYNDLIYDDTIYILNSNYSQLPNQAQQGIGFQYYLQIDYRNYIPYPTSGYYFDMEFTRLGLILTNDYPNLYTIRSTYRKYWDLGSRWYAGFALNGYACTDPKYPFYLQYGLGYDRFYVRGYENNLIKTQFFGLFKSNIQYAILPEKTYYLGFLKNLNKFNKVPLAIYGNLFLDIGGTYDRQFTQGNELSNTGLVGYGLGLDITSYYQRVLRVEFTLNKKSDFSVYLSFIAPL